MSPPANDDEPKRFSATLYRSLDLLRDLGAQLEAAGLVAVPAVPTPAMIAAGIQAGAGTEAGARAIYQAMIAQP